MFEFNPVRGDLEKKRPTGGEKVGFFLRVVVGRRVCARELREKDSLPGFWKEVSRAEPDLGFGDDVWSVLSLIR